VITFILFPDGAALFTLLQNGPSAYAGQSLALFLGIIRRHAPTRARLMPPPTRGLTGTGFP
jgi:hypothetical protein